MSVKEILKESLERNPMGVKEALEEELRARIAAILEEKMSECEVTESEKNGNTLSFNDFKKIITQIETKYNDAYKKDVISWHKKRKYSGEPEIPEKVKFENVKDLGDGYFIYYWDAYSGNGIPDIVKMQKNGSLIVYHGVRSIKDTKRKSQMKSTYTDTKQFIDNLSRISKSGSF